jgi:hypothetical protein
MKKEAKAFTQYEPWVSLRIISDIIVCAKWTNHCIKINALWDTWATVCAISWMSAKIMKLIPIGKKEIWWVHWIQETNCYLVDLILPNNIKIPNMEVVECDIKEDFIIWMNVLRLWDFCISNFQWNTTMSFVVPSQKKTDYVHDWNVRYNPWALKNSRKKKK